MIKPTIFIIEDDPVYSKVINLTLSKNGFTSVHTFSSGENAVESLSLKPDFIILDFSLEGLNGLDTLKVIKQKKANAQIVVLTGVTNENLARKCLENGASHYLEKNDSSMKLILDLLLKIKSKKRNKILMVALVLVIAGIMAIILLM